MCTSYYGVKQKSQICSYHYCVKRQCQTCSCSVTVCYRRVTYALTVTLQNGRVKRAPALLRCATEESNMLLPLAVYNSRVSDMHLPLRCATEESNMHLSFKVCNSGVSKMHLPLLCIIIECQLCSYHHGVQQKSNTHLPRVYNSSVSDNLCICLTKILGSGPETQLFREEITRLNSGNTSSCSFVMPFI